MNEIECLIKDGYVTVERDGKEYKLESASNIARNCFGYELDETWQEIADQGVSIFANDLGIWADIVE